MNMIPQDDVTRKQCSKCKQLKLATAEYFHRNKSQKDGFHSYCIECRLGTKGYAKRKELKNIKVGYKLCSQCMQVFSATAEFFHLNKSTKDGLACYCKECATANSRVSKNLHREEIRVSNKVYYYTHIEQERDRKALDYQVNQEKHLRRSKRYRQTDHAKVSHIFREGERRARKRATMADKVDYQHILNRDGYFCHICYQDIDPTIKKGPASLHFDHVIPLQPRKGEPQGTHSEDNLKPSHAVCNNRKHNTPLEKLTPFKRRGL